MMISSSKIEFLNSYSWVKALMISDFLHDHTGVVIFLAMLTATTLNIFYLKGQSTRLLTSSILSFERTILGN